MSVSPDQQAMWEALGILGFDLDGDETPAAAIAGMSDGGFRAYFLFCAREQRRDYDDALDEIPLGGLAAERERIAQAIEAFLAPAECGCVDCTECALVRQLAAIARMPPQ